MVIFILPLQITVFQSFIFQFTELTMIGIGMCYKIIIYESFHYQKFFCCAPSRWSRKLRSPGSQSTDDQLCQNASGQIATNPWNQRKAAVVLLHASSHAGELYTRPAARRSNQQAGVILFRIPGIIGCRCHLVEDYAFSFFPPSSSDHGWLTSQRTCTFLAPSSYREFLLLQ